MSLAAASPVGAGAGIAARRADPDFADRRIVGQHFFQPRRKLAVDAAFGQQHGFAATLERRQHHRLVIGPIGFGGTGRIVGIHARRGRGGARQHRGECGDRSDPAAHKTTPIPPDSNPPIASKQYRRIAAFRYDPRH